MQKIGAIIQARLASSRLPSKVVKIMPNGKTVIEHIVARLKDVNELDKVIVAIPADEAGTALYQAVIGSGAEVFLGSEDDVLSRYYFCAKKYELDIILRVTADDPFRDIAVESAVLQKIINDKSIDYANSIGLPEGVNTEAFRMRALSKAYHEAILWSEREHVTPYIWKNPQIFKCEQIKFDYSGDHCRLTLDMPEDWALISKIDAALHQDGKVYNLNDIVAFLDKNPELKGINNYIEYNSGYKKSLVEDKVI